ncbi:ABC transporter ATP-binding protein/permease [Geminicoccaceae bacterium 1502E]|nr:ABC transporter ATP-binding protein/permease [Geminicoccaceae bacterium 1502E]
MIDDLVTRIAAGRGFLRKVWTLTRPYWFSEERWFARGVLALLVAMSIFLVWMAKLLNEWNRAFFDALQEKDAAAFWKLIFSVESFEAFFFSFSGLVLVYIVVAVYRVWLRQYLTIRWRRWLTEVYFRDWLDERTYYRMELVNHGADNPEQRIEQDIGLFSLQTLTIGLGLVSELLTLGTFVYVLWGLSGSLVLPLMGGVPVPGYMVWVALLYAIAGSWLTWLIGRRLVGINFDLERYNADFRYRMVRIRENAESIALYGGEADEQQRLRGAFGRIFATWWDYMRVTKRLTWITVFYGQAASIFPIIVQAPRFFAGEIMLGVLTQTAGAFAQVQGSLSWFIDSFAELASWKATVDRLTSFAGTMAETRRRAEAERPFEVVRHAGPELRLEDVEVRVPGGTPLIEHATLAIAKGEAVVIQGPSGSGKTTLFRTLAGLWPFGHGRIGVPEGARVLFLPQKPYLPIGTLEEVLSYPEHPEAYDREAFRTALLACRLPGLVDRLEETANWSLALSPGEQQRVAFARAFLYRPDWLFLDEASSALDRETEAAIYGQLRERLPGVTLVSIAHNPSLLRFHDRCLIIDPQTRSVLFEALPAAAAE